MYSNSFSLEKIFTGKPTTSYQIRSVAQSCPTLCDPMNHSTPGLPVHYFSDFIFQVKYSLFVYWMC